MRIEIDAEHTEEGWEITVGRDADGATLKATRITDGELAIHVGEIPAAWLTDDRDAQ